MSGPAASPAPGPDDGAAAAPAPSLGDLVFRFVGRFRGGGRCSAEVPDDARGRVRLTVLHVEPVTRFEAQVYAADGSLASWIHRARQACARADTVPALENLVGWIEAEEPIPERAIARPATIQRNEVWQPFAHRHDGALVEDDIFLACVDPAAPAVTSVLRRWTDVPAEADQRPTAVEDPRTAVLPREELRRILRRAVAKRFERWHPDDDVVLEELAFSVGFSGGLGRRAAEAVYDVLRERARYDVEVDADTGEGLAFEDPDLVGGGPADDAATALVLEAAGEIAKTGLLAEGADEKATALVEAPDGVLVRAVYESESADGELRTQVFELDPGTRHVARYRLTRG